MPEIDNPDPSRATPVVLNADANFALPLATTLANLDELTAPTGVQPVTVLGEGYDAELRDRVAQGRSSRLEITWVDIAALLPAELPTSERLSRVAYARLLVGSVMAPEVRRVIYLDLDILVRRPLDALASIDLHGRTIGAVVDRSSPCLAMPDALVNWRELGLDGRLPYFNSGVLAVDLDRWRRIGAEGRLLDYLEANRRYLRWHDQDVVNGALAEEFYELPMTWNCQQAPRVRTGTIYAFRPLEETDQAFDDPAIAHFTGHDKPWHPRIVGSAFVDEWRRLARSTALADHLDLDSARARTRSTTTVVRRRVRRAARIVRRGG